MEGDMFGWGKNHHQSSSSASNPNDKRYYDPDSMFNRAKFHGKRIFSKKPKDYGKYIPKEDSNFHQQNRGTNARPDLFSHKYMGWFYMFAYNPFKIRNYKTFDKAEGQDPMFESAKKWFDS
jgi:hypothetical protein